MENFIYRSLIKKVGENMASYNIEMNVKTDTGYDQLYPQTKIKNVENGASKSVSVQVNAPSADWQGDNAPYTLTLTVNGVTAENNIEVGLASNATLDQIKLSMKCIIQCTAQAENQITLTAYKNKPTEDLPVQVLIIG